MGRVYIERSLKSQLPGGEFWYFEIRVRIENCNTDPLIRRKQADLVLWLDPL